MDTQEIVRRTFSYTDDEQAAYSYIGKYMQHITPLLDQILSTPMGQEKFMIAGLFLTYRAFNHWGRNMTTGNLPDLESSIHRNRLITYVSITGNEIQGTDDYLSRLGVSRLKLLLISPQKYLVSYVTKT